MLPHYGYGRHHNGIDERSVSDSIFRKGSVTPSEEGSLDEGELYTSSRFAPKHNQLHLQNQSHVADQACALVPHQRTKAASSKEIEPSDKSSDTLGPALKGVFLLQKAEQCQVLYSVSGSAALHKGPLK